MCNSVEASAAGREPYNKDNEHFATCKAKCCTFCSYCARAFSKNEISPGPQVVNTRKNKLKSVKSVSCVIPLSYVNPVTNAPNVAINLPVGARLQIFWKKWLDLGAGPKVVQILKEGYTLPFRTRPSLSRTPTVISCYGNPHRNLKLLAKLFEVFQALCSRWHRPEIDLFATRFNNKLPLFVSPVPDPMATAVDALSLSLENLDAYAFPPTAILGKVVEKLQDSLYQRLIIIAPGWPNMTWFWDLVEMSSQIPLLLPELPNLLTQPFNQTPHRSLTNLNLHAWLPEPQLSRSRVSLRRWQQELRLLKEDQPDPSMRQSGPFLQSGASQIRWTSGHRL